MGCAAVDGAEELCEFVEALGGLGYVFDAVEFLELGIVLEDLEAGTVVADAFQYLFDVLHVAEVVDGLC